MRTLNFYQRTAIVSVLVFSFAISVVQLLTVSKAGLPTAATPTEPSTAKSDDKSTLPTKPVVENLQPDVTKTLQDYLKKKDDSFQYTVRRKIAHGEGKIVEIILTSQTWQEILWKHQLYMYLPAKVINNKQAILLVDGGAWNKDFENAPKNDDQSLSPSTEIMTKAADALQCPIVVVRQVPQQPMFDNLYEDAIISHTFVKYLQTGDSNWPLLMPMVKSATKAMDVAQEVAKQEWKIDITNFMVTGASKRGWTTWLTASVDKRVNAIAPMVIDVLNMGPQMAQQLSYYGKVSDQIKDYTNRGLLQQFLTKRGQELLHIVDPYAYRSKILQPKMIILATNDRYWTVDALNLYYDELQGEKHVCYIPNSGHTIKDIPRLLGALGAIYQEAAGKSEIPDFNWKYETTKSGVKLSIAAKETPKEVLFWKAVCTTRDFREVEFTSTKVEFKDGAATIEQPLPASGYMAIYAEAQFAREPFPCPLTTTIRVLGPQKTDH